MNSGNRECDRFDALVEIGVQRTLTDAEAEELFSHIEDCHTGLHSFAGVEAELNLPRDVFTHGSIEHGIISTAELAKRLMKRLGWATNESPSSIAPSDTSNGAEPERKAATSLGALPERKLAGSRVVQIQSRRMPRVLIPRYGPRMVCSFPLALADACVNDDAPFAFENNLRNLPLGAPLPAGYQRRNGVVTAPCCTTLGPLAQMERFRAGKPWLAFAGITHRDSVLVVRRESELANKVDDELAGVLTGKCIAVTDHRSIFSLRLAELCWRFGIKCEFKFSGIGQRNMDRLVLVKLEPERMAESLMRNEVDAFLSGEPWRSAALVQHGEKNLFAAARLLPQLVSTPFCCVPVVDQRLADRYPDVLVSLVQAFSEVLLRIALRDPETMDRMQALLEQWGLTPFQSKVAAHFAVSHVAGHVEQALELVGKPGDVSRIDQILQPGVSREAFLGEHALLRNLDPDEAAAARSDALKHRVVTPEEFYHFDLVRRTLREVLAKAIDSRGEGVLRAQFEKVQKEAMDVPDAECAKGALERKRIAVVS